MTKNALCGEITAGGPCCVPMPCPAHPGGARGFLTKLDLSTADPSAPSVASLAVQAGKKALQRANDWGTGLDEVVAETEATKVIRAVATDPATRERAEALFDDLCVCEPPWPDRGHHDPLCSARQEGAWFAVGRVLAALDPGGQS